MPHTCRCANHGDASLYDNLMQASAALSLGVHTQAEWCLRLTEARPM